MNIQQFIKLAVATTVISTFSGHAKAHSCGELSPLMTALGKQYTELTYSPETSASKANSNSVDLIGLIEQLELRSGHGVRVECFGTNGRWKEDSTTFTLTDIDHRENNKGALMLSAAEESEKYTNREVIELPKAEKWQMTSDNEFSTSYLFRLQNFSSDGSRAAEIALTIQNNDTALVVTEVLYINGLKVDWVTWELDS